jgi:hypothetical protein
LLGIIRILNFWYTTVFFLQMFSTRILSVVLYLVILYRKLKTEILAL